MHEFSLYGQVAIENYNIMLQQLTGVSRMQPKYVQEIHLVFRPNVPPGLRLIPAAINSDRIQNPEVQRVSNMLINNIHYVQLVGKIEAAGARKSNGDIEMTNGVKQHASAPKVRWELDFKDTPQPGKQAVSSRQISSILFKMGT